jgi:hypothetical protein
MEALGRLFDISTGVAPVDLQAAQTGKRVHLKNAGGATIVVFKAAGTAGDDQTWTLQEHDASTGGTSQSLAVISHYYEKVETTLDGDETWAERDNLSGGSPQATILDATTAEVQQIMAIEVDSTQLSDGFEWISLNNDGAGANAQLGAVLYFLRDLAVQRDPTKLAEPLS